MDSNSNGTRGKKTIVILVAITVAIGVTYIFGTNLSSQLGHSTKIQNNNAYDDNGADIDKRITLLTNQQPAIHLPHQHVYYLKTHKTGSTTMHNILAEYCRAHDLTPLLPSHGDHINQGGQFSPDQIKVYSDFKTYDMIFSHHIYSPKLFNYMHADTFNITTLREPFTAFVSAFLYYRNMWHSWYLEKVPTGDPITEFLRHPEKYEVKGDWTWTNNRQCIDMGYDFSKGFKNMTYIKEFVELSDSRFNLVIIMEYFDEGLVLMKRLLHWKTEDILYMHSNGGTYYKKDVNNSKDLETDRRQLFDKFSQADNMVYNHFLKRFKKAKEGQSGLHEEVAEFQDILVKFRDYCSHMATSSETLIIPAGKWTNAFQMTKYKCKMVQKPSTNFLRARENEVFTR